MEETDVVTTDEVKTVIETNDQQSLLIESHTEKEPTDDQRYILKLNAELELLYERVRELEEEKEDIIEQAKSFVLYKRDDYAKQAKQFVASITTERDRLKQECEDLKQSNEELQSELTKTKQELQVLMEQQQQQQQQLIEKQQEQSSYSPNSSQEVAVDTSSALVSRLQEELETQISIKHSLLSFVEKIEKMTAPQQLATVIYTSLSAENIDSSGNRKSGFLTKQGQLRKTWKSRFFVLRDNFLFYYDNQHDVQPLDVIPLLNHVVDEVDKGFINKDFCFKVQLPNGKEYYCCANSEEEKIGWVEALRDTRPWWQQIEQNRSTRRDSKLSSTLAPQRRMSGFKFF